MISNRILLMIVGAIILVMGILGALPDDILNIGTEPIWHAIIKIVIGLIAIGIAYTNKEK
ncbi:MAG: hypothetical protein JXA91_07075 [Candidatus Thermoplasmatota archaeon]|nr:hypothetical protein [Candidatus Thermoplasmatota archaeon]